VTPKLFRAAEVCEAAGLQPYVLRSWEKEFPGIGVQRSQDSPRMYRQADLDQVLRIKQLVFGEGLTLAGARRRIEETSPARPDDEARAEVMETLGADARTRIAKVRVGLQSLLDVLSTVPGGSPARGIGRREAVTLATDRSQPKPSGPASLKRPLAARAKSAASKAKMASKGAAPAKGLQRARRERAAV
jgi:DNA-binding transcriptional MerR regulator